MATWHQDEQEEERGKRVLCVRKKGTLQYLGKPLCGSGKLHITQRDIFPPNYFGPVSFPTVSVKGLWCSGLIVVQLHLLSLPHHKADATWIGGMEEESVCSFLLPPSL